MQDILANTNIKVGESIDMSVDDSGFIDACNKIISRKVIRPSRDVLKEEIRTTTFRELSYKYNVSDKAIVKWCKSYNLPHTKSLIKTYSDYEWELI